MVGRAIPGCAACRVLGHFDAWIFFWTMMPLSIFTKYSVGAGRSLAMCLVTGARYNAKLIKTARKSC